MISFLKYPDVGLFLRSGHAIYSMLFALHKRPMKCLACAILTMYRCRFTTPYLDTGYCTKPGSGTPSVYTALLAVCMPSAVTEGSWHTLVVTVDTVVTRPAADPPSADQPCWPTAHTSDPPHTADDAPSINLSHTMRDIVVQFIFVHTSILMLSVLDVHSTLWLRKCCSVSQKQLQQWIALHPQLVAGLYPVDAQFGGNPYTRGQNLCPARVPVRAGVSQYFSGHSQTLFFSLTAQFKPFSKQNLNYVGPVSSTILMSFPYLF